MPDSSSPPLGAVLTPPPLATFAELDGVFAAMDDIVLVLSREGRYLKIPATNAHHLYRPPDEMLGKLVHEVLPLERADAICAVILRALDERRPVKWEYPLDIEGETVWFSATVSPLDVASVVWVARDTTSERRTQEALAESEARYRLLFERHPTPMWVFDRETLAFLTVNAAAVEHYGYTREEFLGMTLRDIRPQEELPALEARLGVPSGSHGVFRHRTKDGRIMDVGIVSDAIPFAEREAELVMATDVTDQLRMEEHLRQVQKIEAVGQLAAGIAHDFNNLLTVILTHCEFLHSAVPQGGEGSEDLSEIRKAATRAAGLTRELLAFSRKQILQPEAFDVNEKVAELRSMLARLIGEDIEMEIGLSEEPCIVLADPHQLEHVLVNLAVNARDAMPAGGRLTIRTETVTVGEDRLHEGEVLEPGEYALLTVTDSGMGMTAEVRERIFEPFFTTKEQGRGTGLGLATVHGIVRQSRGHVSVGSEPGRGASFRVYLPRQMEDHARQPAAPRQSPERRGKEIVLLAEDEPAVRAATRRILERDGYTVIEATNGREALKRAAAVPGPIDLLLTDAIMPEMGGGALASELSRLRPEIKVLFMSGYTDDQIIRGGVTTRKVELLQKPFEIAELLQRVRAVLDCTD